MTGDPNMLDVAFSRHAASAGELDDTLFRGLSNRERMRLTETLSAVPQDARSVLEIGFNDFRMTRALLRFHDVVTTDLPREIAPRPAAFKLVFCNVRALPFTDQAFDIIVCTEVLEHLDEATLRLGIAELARGAPGTFS